MRVTIIRDDGLVGVDGEFREVDLSALDPNVHAVQWDGAKGHVEYKDGRPEGVLNGISQYQAFIDAWDAVVPPPEPPRSPPRALLTSTQAAESLRGNKALLGLARHVLNDITLTEDQLVAAVKAKLP